MVIATAGVETFYTPSDIVNRLVEQLGLLSQNKPVINIKVSRVDAYTTPTGSSTDRPAISMDVSSVTPSIGDPATPGSAEVFYGIMKRLADQGNLSDAAKVSYTWPRHMADQPLSSNAVFTLVGVAGNLANTLVRFHLLWSLTDVAAPALLSSARSLGPEPVEIEDEELLATPCVEIHSLSPTH
jgi:hypothetical protein